MIGQRSVPQTWSDIRLKESPATCVQWLRVERISLQTLKGSDDAML